MRTHGFDVWQEPYVTRRLPMLFDLQMDPFEPAKESRDFRIGAPTAGLLGE